MLVCHLWGGTVVGDEGREEAEIFVACEKDIGFPLHPVEE